MAKEEESLLRKTDMRGWRPHINPFPSLSPLNYDLSSTTLDPSLVVLMARNHKVSNWYNVRKTSWVGVSVSWRGCQLVEVLRCYPMSQRLSVSTGAGLINAVPYFLEPPPLPSPILTSPPFCGLLSAVAKMEDSSPMLPHPFGSVEVRNAIPSKASPSCTRVLLIF
jgi:hypothetical protein